MQIGHAILNDRPKKIELLFPSFISVFFFFTEAAAGSYTESAHGSSTSGVMRNDTALADYSKGNCSHCHEQHGSINGTEPSPASGSVSPFAVFADNFNTGAILNTYLQSDNFCFYCHANASSLQSGGIENKDYSATFAGYSTNSPLGIFEAFNQHSYHNLFDIKDFAETSFSSTFTSESNPCVACHNPHMAKRNKANVQDPSYTVLSKPSDHGNLWGDDSTERMDSNPSYSHQSPLYYGSSTTYEPGGTSYDDGSLTPDYNAFCTDCHNTTNTIYSTTLERNLIKIDWYTLGGDGISTGDKHGRNSATVDGTTIIPYNGTIDLVLSCLDCHEPHGSPSSFLIRREVNGAVTSGDVHTAATSPSSTSTLKLLCEKCHLPNWSGIHHGPGAGDPPYDKDMTCSCHGVKPPVPIPCEQCHYHGATVSNCDKTTPAIRKTF
ncbi:MAG: hypothetical protein KQH63_15745 [Desulfobulbaceae bacterium]|nr:hypothetical protein [Desulfobulbaceae bacterium]